MMTLDDFRATAPVLKVEEVYLCPGCEKKFKDNYDAQNHCEPEKEYACPVCPETFWRKDEAEEHLRQPHDQFNDPSPMEIYLEGLRFGNLPVLELQRRYINSVLEGQFEARNRR